MLREVESDPDSVSGTRSTPDVNRFFRLIGPNITQSFSGLFLHLIQLTDKHRHTSRTDYIISRTLLTEEKVSVLPDKDITIVTL